MTDLKTLENCKRVLKIWTASSKSKSCSRKSRWDYWKSTQTWLTLALPEYKDMICSIKLKYLLWIIFLKEQETSLTPRVLTKLSINFLSLLKVSTLETFLVTRHSPSIRYLSRQRTYLMGSIRKENHLYWESLLPQGGATLPPKVLQERIYNQPCNSSLLEDLWETKRISIKSKVFVEIL